MDFDKDNFSVDVNIKENKFDDYDLQSHNHGRPCCNASITTPNYVPNKRLRRGSALWR